MEYLKRLEDIYEPDERYLNRVDIDHSTGAITPTTIKSIYSVIESIQLNNNVPESIRSQFNVARNLALYSWFVYPFNEVAAMQALASLEMAVRAKTGNNKDSFKNLLNKLFKGRQLALNLSLGKAISSLRNEMAHGSTVLRGQGISFLRTCSELINELYP